MKRKIATTVLLIFSFMICLAAQAVDLNGNWKGSIKTPDGNEFPLAYTFKIDGDNVTGTATGPNGDTPVTDGKANGSDFSFNLSINGSNITHNCKYYSAGDSISMNIDLNGAKIHAQLTRDTK